MRGAGDVIIRVNMRQNATCVKMSQGKCDEMVGKLGFLKKFAGLFKEVCKSSLVMAVLAGADSGH